MSGSWKNCLINNICIFQWKYKMAVCCTSRFLWFRPQLSHRNKRMDPRILFPTPRFFSATVCTRVRHMKTLNCMLQAGPPSLHYYCAVVLYSCIVLPPVGHSSSHRYHCCQLKRQSSFGSNLYRTFKVFIWLSLVFVDRTMLIVFCVIRNYVE